MRPVNEKLRADLLEAGKREFMENGFRGASLKSIAASLGVTTGRFTATIRTRRHCLTDW